MTAFLIAQFILNVCFIVFLVIYLREKRKYEVDRTRHRTHPPDPVPTISSRDPATQRWLSDTTVGGRGGLRSPQLVLHPAQQRVYKWDEAFSGPATTITPIESVTAEAPGPTPEPPPTGPGDSHPA